MHLRNSLRLGFKRLAKSIETIKVIVEVSAIVIPCIFHISIPQHMWKNVSGFKCVTACGDSRGFGCNLLGSEDKEDMKTEPSWEEHDDVITIYNMFANITEEF